MSQAPPHGALPAWLQVNKDGVVVSVWVKPRAKKTAVLGTHGDAVAIQLAAPPVDGAANALLLKHLAAMLRVGNHQVALLSGDTSRGKRVLILGVTPAQVAQALGMESA